MKPTINKSKLMKTAWVYFRTYKTWSFSDCMKKAWRVEKKRVEVELQLESEKKEKVTSVPKVNPITIETYNHFYRNSRYIGD